MRSGIENSLLHEVRFRSGKFHGTHLTLTGNFNIYSKGQPTYWLNPDGATRVVTLPEFEEGLFFFIFNVGGSGTIIVRDHLGVTLTALVPSTGVAVFSSGASWGLLSGGAGDKRLVVEHTSGDLVVGIGDEGKVFVINKSVGSPTSVFLPPSAGLRMPIKIVDGKLDAATNPISVVPNGTEKILGLSSWELNMIGASGDFWPRPDGGGWFL